MRDFLDATRNRVIVFDGGMGATLEQFDLSLENDYKLPGRAHEALVLNRPDVIEGVHASMVEAGADVVETDTFQASRLKLEEWGLQDHTVEINVRAAEIARKAVGEDRFVAGSIGPTGFLPSSDDPTLGNIRFRDLVTVFQEQAEGLLRGGVDVLIVETAQDILEVKATIFGIREAFRTTGRRVPIQASVFVLPNNGKMLLGTDISSVLTTLEALKVDIIGLNCSSGPEDMRDAIRFLGEYASTPIHCIPNAGIPTRAPTARRSSPRSPAPGRHPRRLRRPLRPVDRRRLLRHHPDHIRAVAERCKGHDRLHRRPRAPRVLDDRRHALVQEPRPTIVGERVTRRAHARQGCCWPTTTTASCRSPRTRSRAAPTCWTSAWPSPSARTRTSRCAAWPGASASASPRRCRSTPPSRT